MGSFMGKTLIPTHSGEEVFFLLVFLTVVSCVDVASKDLFLPTSHLPYHSSLDKKCWGYEPECHHDHSFSQNFTECSQTQDRSKFYDEADFGYVKTKLLTLEHLCSPSQSEDSELQCTEQAQLCTGRRIKIDFRDIPMDRLIQYDINVLKYGQIGGNCDVRQDFIASNSNYMSALQSWAPEMRNFARLNHSDDWCDLEVFEPVLVMKLDATVNMYHHFCDFFNLYASQHLLSAAHFPELRAFERNVRVIIWENVPYRSSFQSAFNVFTKHPIWSLADVAGKKVCFKNAVHFPLLPRMVYGLFYNTPLSSETCYGSGLFKAFSEFMPYRMGLDEPISPKRDGKLRVTILNRKTPYRNIVNLEEIVSKLSPYYQVTVANFSHQRPPFKHQMSLIRKTDILVGIHGAGLTHMLFLPDWAAVFELYHCEDPECYRDLARMRGVKHIGWEDPSKLTPVPSEQPQPGYAGTASAKFQDYRFDPLEVLRLTNLAKSHVTSHPAFNENHQGKEEL